MTPNKKKRPRPGKGRKVKRPSAITVTCLACSWEGSRRLAHEHHVKPRKAGGSDDKENLIWLCAGCHTNIHAIGYAFQFNRGAEALDLINSNYQSARSRALVAELAKTVAYELTLKKESGGPDLHTVTLQIPKLEFLAVQALARESKLSVANFYLHLARALLDKNTRDHVTSKPSNREALSPPSMIRCKV